MTRGPLATVYGRLRDAATGHVDAQAVQQSLGLRSRYLAERLLAALDVGGVGFATPSDFAAAAEQMMAAPVHDKIRFLFRMQDHDGDGRITREEFERMIHIGMAEQRLRLPGEAPQRLVDAVFAAADRDRNGSITLPEFLAMVVARPGLCERLAAHGVMLLTPGRRARERSEASPSAARWTGDRVVVLVFVALFAVANVVAFASGFIAHRGETVWIQIARGCGAAINLDAALIVVPMLRGLLTWVRRRWFGRFIPVDASVDAHRLIGETLAALTLLHGLAHIANVPATRQPWSVLLTGPWLTGLVLMWILLVIWVFARRRVRRSGDFELFHFTHLLYVPFFALALAHGPSLWMWIAAPLTGYLVERVLRALRRGAVTQVLCASVLPGEVVRLDIRRPRGFDYSPGDYAFVRIPGIARHEWHPFTITSAPEDADVLSFHVRTLGNWTGALHHAAQRGQAEGAAIHIDGPYGAPATHLPDSEHAVAVAAGIGVTPFAAILRSLLIRMHASPGPLRKLHFIWVCREQESFGWFADLLARLEAVDRHHLLDIRIYLTQARDDLGGSAFELARELDHDARGSDLVTGLGVKTAFGRPDLGALLREFVASPGLPPPDVYFCGPAGLSRQLSRQCRAQGLTYRQERF